MNPAADAGARHGGAGAPWQAAFAAALLDPGAATPPGLRAWNGHEPTRRFGVYRNNVMASLCSALADTFAVVQAMVGEEFFRAMAAAYVRRSPPASPLLLLHGRGFADFIAGFAPAAGVPWLADTARLEYARAEAFHAADAPILQPQALAGALQLGERLGQLRLVLHPAVRLVASPYAIASLWQAHQDGGPELSGIDPRVPQTVLVTRPQWAVRTVACEAGSWAFAEALREGLDLGTCAGAALAHDRAFDLSACLAQLLAQGALSTVHFPKE